MELLFGETRKEGGRRGSGVQKLNVVTKHTKQSSPMVPRLLGPKPWNDQFSTLSSLPIELNKSQVMCS